MMQILVLIELEIREVELTILVCREMRNAETKKNTSTEKSKSRSCRTLKNY